jgi:prophage antirepressor-like protein
MDMAKALDQDAKSAAYNASSTLGPKELVTLRKSKVTPELQGLFSGTVARITVISESGLYKYVLRAQRKNPLASFFQDWVTQEVLPRSRKTGSYIMGEENKTQRISQGGSYL